MRFFLSTAAAIVVAATALPSFAADAMVPMYDGPTGSSDWSGFYIGIMAGAGSFEGSVRDNGGDALDADGQIVGLPAFAGLVGVGVGANFQDGAAIYGVDADISYVGYSTEQTFDDDYRVEASMDWLATLRGRVGMAVDNAMFYATAGVGYANISGCASDDEDTCVPDDDEIANFSGGVAGLVIGAGAEVALSENMSLKAEYLYFQSGEASVAYDSGVADDVAYFYSSAHIARVGLNWGF